MFEFSARCCPLGVRARRGAPTTRAASPRSSFQKRGRATTPQHCRRTRGPHDGRDPLVDVVAFGSGRAVGRRVERNLGELLLDALGAGRARAPRLEQARHTWVGAGAWRGGPGGFGECVCRGRMCSPPRSSSKTWRTHDEPRSALFQLVGARRGKGERRARMRGRTSVVGRECAVCGVA